MTLRTRLFLVVGSLVAAVVVAQWWWMGRMTQEISNELDQVAFTVGEQVAQVLVAAPLGGSHKVIQCVGSECEEEHWTVGPEGAPHRIERRRFQDDGQQMRWVRGRGDTVIEIDPEALADGEEGRDPSPVRIETLDLRLDPEDEDIRARLEGDTVDFVARRVVESSVVLRGDSGDSQSYAFWFEMDPGVVVEHNGTEPVFESAAEGGHTSAGHPTGDQRGEHDHDARLAVHLIHSGETRFLEMASPTARRQIRIPQEGLANTFERFQRRALMGSLGILVLGLALTGLVAHRISAPLRQLSEAAGRVGEGDWGVRIPVPASGEVAQAVTAFNRMSGRLAELDARARELETQRHLGEIGEIARGLAHSLRNPLNALGLSLEELASRGGDDVSTTALAAASRRQIGRIDRNIRSFLALASQGGGTAESVDLSELVQDVALEAIQDAQGKVRLEVAGGDVARPLTAVAPELRAVIQALLINAVEASPPQGQVRAELESLDDGGHRLAIEDRGPGLPPEIRERLFTPHLSTKSHGSGMGLFLAHRIATSRYGGRLALEDREGGGTRVVLELGDRSAMPTSAESSVETAPEEVS